MPFTPCTYQAIHRLLKLVNAAALAAVLVRHGLSYRVDAANCGALRLSQREPTVSPTKTYALDTSAQASWDHKREAICGSKSSCLAPGSGIGVEWYELLHQTCNPVSTTFAFKMCKGAHMSWKLSMRLQALDACSLSDWTMSDLSDRWELPCGRKAVAQTR